jgi:hypothetical protein
MPTYGFISKEYEFYVYIGMMCPGGFNAILAIGTAYGANFSCSLSDFGVSHQVSLAVFGIATLVSIAVFLMLNQLVMTENSGLAANCFRCLLVFMVFFQYAWYIIMSTSLFENTIPYCHSGEGVYTLGLVIFVINTLLAVIGTGIGILGCVIAMTR